MKYWIGINVISNTPGLLTAAENATPFKVDNRLWQTDEYKSARGVDLDGNNFFYASLFFNDLMDWGLHFNRLSVMGILNSAMKDSYIKMTECFHDEKVNGLCKKLDDLVYEEVIK